MPCNCLVDHMRQHAACWRAHSDHIRCTADAHSARALASNARKAVTNQLSPAGGRETIGAAPLIDPPSIVYEREPYTRTGSNS